MASLGDFVDRVARSADPAFLLAVQQAKFEEAASSRLASLDPAVAATTITIPTTATTTTAAAAAAAAAPEEATAAPLSLQRHPEANTQEQKMKKKKKKKQEKATDGPKMQDDASPRKKLKPSSQGSVHETPANTRSWLQQAIEKTLLGMLVGDAISIPLHWYYDHAALQQHIKDHYSKIPGAVDEEGRLVAIVPIAKALRSAHPSSWQCVFRVHLRLERADWVLWRSRLSHFVSETGTSKRRLPAELPR